MSANLQSACRRRAAARKKQNPRARQNLYFTWAKHPELPRGMEPGSALVRDVADPRARVNFRAAHAPRAGIGA